MERFILRRNIARYREIVATEEDPRLRSTFATLLAEASRKLALIDAASRGAPLGDTVVAPAKSLFPGARTIRDHIERSNECFLLLDPGPGLHIVEANDAYLSATWTERSRICGERVFDAFPDNPGDAGADGVFNLFGSLSHAAATGRTDVMAVQRYDVRDATGIFVERRWLPENIPIFDEEGRLMYLLHHVQRV